MTAGLSAEYAATVKDEPLAYGTLLRENVIKIEVGAGHVEYFVHPGLLSQHSEYFKRALNGSWKEAEERVVRLDDIDCDTFELFLEWLYSQQYPKDYQFGGSCENQLARVKACAFGDRFLALAFRVASESALIDSLVVEPRSPYYDAIIYAYEHLSSESPVLQALVDSHCYGFAEGLDTHKNGELQRRSQLPHSFLVAVMVRYMHLQHGKKGRLDRCDYHGHASDNERGKKCQVPLIDEFESD